jgi:hypothetical protein
MIRVARQEVVAAGLLAFTAAGAAAREITLSDPPRVSGAGKVRFQENGASLPAISFELLAVPLAPGADWLIYAAHAERVVGVATREAATAQLERGAASAEPLKPFTGNAAAVSVLVTVARAQLPVDAVATAEGVTLRFAVTLNTRLAADPDSWVIELIGPPRSAVKMTGIAIGTDDRSVFLPVEGLAPGTQLRIRYALRGAEGEVLDAAFFASLTTSQPE